MYFNYENYESKISISVIYNLLLKLIRGIGLFNRSLVWSSFIILNHEHSYSVVATIAHKYSLLVRLILGSCDSYTYWSALPV